MVNWLPRTTRSTVPAERRQAALLAQHQRRDARRPGRLRRCRRARSATSGTRTSTTALGPPGLVRLSSTTVNVAAAARSTTASTYAPARDAQPHPVPARRAARSCSAPARSSGPGASTATHDAPATPPPDVRMQQATVNLLADMGVQPGDAAGRPRRRRPRPTDSTAPDVDDHARRPPARPSRADVRSRSPARHDAGGGVVAASRSPTDGGATWHPATGRDELDLHVDAAGDRARRRSRAAPSTTAATSRRPAPA